jgi:hypothetical protein
VPLLEVHVSFHQKVAHNLDDKPLCIVVQANLAHNVFNPPAAPGAKSAYNLLVSITLQQILDLVGTLDDSSGQNTPRERFRKFLEQNVSEVGQLRDYIEECLRTSGISTAVRYKIS